MKKMSSKKHWDILNAAHIRAQPTPRATRLRLEVGPAMGSQTALPEVESGGMYPEAKKKKKKKRKKPSLTTQPPLANHRAGVHQFDQLHNCRKAPSLIPSQIFKFLARLPANIAQTGSAPDREQRHLVPVPVVKYELNEPLLHTRFWRFGRLELGGVKIFIHCAMDFPH